MKMNYYSIKKLIKGYRVNPNLKNKTLIAIPQKKLYTQYGFIPIQVNYQDQKMSITRNTPLLHREQFRDKFNRGTFYTLLYYEWNPAKVQLEINF